MNSKEEQHQKGKFFVLYGANNLGKSEQIQRLAKKLITEGYQLLCLKYPIYALEPTGPKINRILRHPDELSKPVEEVVLQEYFAQNRRDFQKTLIKCLDVGINVLAEDYTGTGIAWGMTRGVPLEKLEELNKGLLVPDMALVLDGERFSNGAEKKHRNESAGKDVWKKSREIHRKLAKRYNWKIVNANQSRKEVHSDIWKLTRSVLLVGN